MIENHTVTLEPVPRKDLSLFAKKLQEAFAVAVIETFGSADNGPIPSDETIWESFDAPNAVVYHIVEKGQCVGGVVLRINEVTQRNALDLFFISPAHHSKGLGLKTWRTIEDAYPKTLVWETITPYFEQRNIHFYVNKCGFQIVEFFNAHHVDPHRHHTESQSGEDIPSMDTYFRFEKVMRFSK